MIQTEKIPRSMGISKFAKALPIALSVLLLLLFYKGQHFYHSPNSLVDNNPLVINLKKEKVQTKVKFGNSPNCGKQECWVKSEMNTDDWQSLILPLNPNSNISGLAGYKANTKSESGWIYYRTILHVPDDLAGIDEEISYSQVFIMHKKYEVYVAGRQTYVSDGVGLGRIGNFPIPKSDIVNGKVTVVIKGSLEPEDRGIAHFGSSYLGPKTALDSVYLFSERATYSFYLLFILSKGAIFVVFALFFFFSSVHDGFKNFLAFAFFVTIENLFMGEFLADVYLSLNQRVFLTYLCKSVSVACLLSFFVNFFQANKLKTAGLTLNTVAVFTILVMAFDFAWGSNSVTFKHLWEISNGYLIFTIAGALLLGINSIKTWKKNDARGSQLNSYIYVTAFVSIYFLLSIDAFYFKSYTGYGSRNLFDLAFFFLLATVTAKNMGSQQETIHTLEGHMHEKARMEMELQEAAEITKAFIPDEPPDWDAFIISTFHKPLTENSGDWYAFEKSASGKFFHHIMCDITGHGVQAAIVVSTCKSILSSFTHTKAEEMDSSDFITKFMSELNWILFNNGGGLHVSTLLGLSFEPAAEKLHYICAGHPSPLFIDGANKGSKPKILVSRNNVLGINSSFLGDMKTTVFKGGDQLIAYTDGLPVGSNIVALQEFLKRSESGDNASHRDLSSGLAKAIWDTEFSRFNKEVDDDISVVWFQQTKNQIKMT